MPKLKYRDRRRITTTEGKTYILRPGRRVSDEAKDKRVHTSTSNR